MHYFKSEPLSVSQSVKISGCQKIGLPHHYDIKCIIVQEIILCYITP